MKEDLITAVEPLSGRKVLAFLSDNHIKPGVAVESFVLEPRSGGAPDDLEAEPKQTSS